jgi:hypothetical protein
MDITCKNDLDDLFAGHNRDFQKLGKLIDMDA